MSLRILESFSRALIRSVLIFPTNLDVPVRARLATLVKKMGNFVSEAPQCGVARKIIPATDSRILP